MRTLLAAIVLTSLSTSALAGPSVGMSLGTRGISPQLGFSFSEQWAVRATLSVLKYDYDTSEDSIDYNAELSLESLSLLGDWHPAGGRFRLSAGLVLYQDEIDLVSKPSNGCVQLGSSPFCRPVNNDDRIVGHIAWSNEVVPYIGIGWGNTARAGWGFSADLGLIFTDNPRARLRAEGSSFASDPTVQQEVQQEEDDLNDSLDNAKVWPVLNVGAFYRF